MSAADAEMPRVALCSLCLDDERPGFSPTEKEMDALWAVSRHPVEVPGTSHAPWAAHLQLPPRQASFMLADQHRPRGPYGVWGYAPLPLLT